MVKLSNGLLPDTILLLAWDTKGKPSSATASPLSATTGLGLARQLISGC
jgi:hypothetical protein